MEFLKRFFRTFCLVLFCLLGSLTLASCGGDDDDDDEILPPPETPAVSPIVGTWMERFDNGSYIEVNTFTFKETGKGSWVYREEDYKGQGVSADPRNFSYVYKEDDGIIRMTFENDATLYSGTADITGNTLILRIADTYFSLTRR